VPPQVTLHSGDTVTGSRLVPGNQRWPPNTTREITTCDWRRSAGAVTASAAATPRASVVRVVTVRIAWLARRRRPQEEADRWESGTIAIGTSLAGWRHCRGHFNTSTIRTGKPTPAINTTTPNPANDSNDAAITATPSRLGVQAVIFGSACGTQAISAARYCPPRQYQRLGHRRASTSTAVRGSRRGRTGGQACRWSCPGFSARPRSSRRKRG
jgi:hypothetical protein